MREEKGEPDRICRAAGRTMGMDFLVWTHCLISMSKCGIKVEEFE